MNSILRILALLLVIVAAGIIAYTIGKRAGQSETRTELIQNYTFVKEIAELASLEVGGTTTFRSSNIGSDDNGVLGAFKKGLFENSVSLTVPFTAKYGVDLSRDSVRILPEGDSVLRLQLPAPRLLSYELHLDRIDAQQRTGLIYFEREPMKQALYKKLYANSRAEMVNNPTYLNRTQDQICRILQGYYRAAKMRVVCAFGERRVRAD